MATCYLVENKCGQSFGEGQLFSALGRLLHNRQTGGLEWTRYQKLTSELPYKAGRYEALEVDIEDVQAQLAKFVGFD